MNKEAREHVADLGRHGAYVLTGAWRERLSGAFYDKIVQFCEEYKIRCIEYEIQIPETDDPMRLLIWRNGHVDSGHADHIRDIMEQGTVRRYLHDYQGSASDGH